MAAQYDPVWVSKFYDQYGEREWSRWEESPLQAVRFHVHGHYLKRFLRPGNRVLEAGAGSGRFTQALAALGAKVTVADLSDRQLELNARQAKALGFEAAVAERVKVDICDLGRFPDSSFDAVVCFGGPLSYVFDQREKALSELVRVAKPGAPLLLSVMSTFGSTQEYLKGVLGGEGSLQQVRDVVHTGDLHPENWPMPTDTHRCHMFTAAELKACLLAHGTTVLALSASNALGNGNREFLESLRSDPERWAALLDLELEACANPGCLDMGTHLIAVAQKPG